MKLALLIAACLVAGTVRGWAGSYYPLETVDNPFTGRREAKRAYFFERHGIEGGVAVEWIGPLKGYKDIEVGLGSDSRIYWRKRGEVQP